MKVGADDFRRVYESLNDEALLAVKRDELVELAQQCYDVEVAARGLAARDDAAAVVPPGNPEAAGDGEELVEVAGFRRRRQLCAGHFDVHATTMAGDRARADRDLRPWISQRYVEEQTFRFNERKDNDGSRFRKVLGSVTGRRLTYKALISHASHAI